MALPAPRRGLNLGRQIRGFLGLTHNPMAQDPTMAARYALPSVKVGIQHPSSFRALCDTLDGYRFNTIFEQLGPAAFDLVLADKLDDVRLRGIYNPIPTIVEFYTNHVLTGRMVPPPPRDSKILDDPDAVLPDGDLWIRSDNPSLDEAVAKVWGWSNLQLTKAEISTNCAAYGNALLVVSEVPPEKPGDTGQVHIEVLHPACLIDAEYDRVGNLTYAMIETREYRRDAMGMRIPYSFTRIYTPDFFETRVNGGNQAYGPNPHGFVPVVHIKHRAVTHDQWGLAAFSHALPMIQELCVAASVLSGNIQKHEKPRWVVMGAVAPAASEEVASWQDMLFIPSGASVDVLIPKLDIAGVYLHAREILDRLEAWFPELTLNQLGSGKRDVSGAGIRGLASGLIRKGLAAREREEEGLKLALQMAIRMGHNLGGLSLNVFGGAVGDLALPATLEFTFHWPDIMPMNRLERLRVFVEEKTLELQAATLEAQLVYGKAHPDALLQFKAPQMLGGQIAPGAPSPGQPPQGTPVNG